MLEGVGKHDPTAFSNVVGCWPMDEVSTEPISGVSIPDPTVWWRYAGDGSTVTDEGTAGINGTVVNGPVPVSADGYEFDGVNQYVAATYSPAPNSQAISLAVVCKADSFSSNEAESPTRKMPLALGAPDSPANSYRGAALHFVRSSSGPDRASCRFSVANASTDIAAVSVDDLCDVGVRMCLVGSADLSKDLSRLLYADENGKVRFYTAYNSFTAIAYDTTSPQLETGRHRQSNINDRYWDGTIKEAQVYDGVALDFRQMLQLAQELLGIEFNLPHLVDTSGNGRHLYAEQPEQFGEILMTQLAPGLTGVALNGGSGGAEGSPYHSLWYPDPQNDFRIWGTTNMAVGIIAVMGDQIGDRSITTARIVSCSGDNNNTNVQAKNELWAMAVTGDTMAVSCYHESGTGTDRNVTDEEQALTVGLLAHIWMSRATGVTYKRWLNGVLSPNSPMTSTLAPTDDGEQSCLRVGGKEPGYGTIRGAVTSLILINGSADDADAALGFEQTVGAAFTREVP